MYKRNQMEWALWHTLDRGHLTAQDLPSSIRNTLRRLIDVDRKFWVNTRSPEIWNHRFAFIEGVPQGRGGENHYRLQEVLILWLALQSLSMGFPQRETIQFLRTLKPQIDDECGRIYAAQRERITTAAKKRDSTARALRTRTHVPPSDHVYLVSPTVSGAIATAPTKLSWFAHGPTELVELTATFAQSDTRIVLFEIANPVASLTYFLALSPLAKRGRAAVDPGT